MNGKESRKTMRVLPLEQGFSEESRAAKIAALKALVVAGAYRLDATAVAAAMLEAGAIEFETAAFDLSQDGEMRRAMRRFVVAPAPTREHPAHPSGRLRVVSAG